MLYTALRRQSIWDSMTRSYTKSTACCLSTRVVKQLGRRSDEEMGLREGVLGEKAVSLKRGEEEENLTTEGETVSSRTCLTQFAERQRQAG